MSTLDIPLGLRTSVRLLDIAGLGGYFIANDHDPRGIKLTENKQVVCGKPGLSLLMFRYCSTASRGAVKVQRYVGY